MQSLTQHPVFAMHVNTEATVPSIYLASRSPRRAEILQQLGVRFSVLPSDIDESLQAGEQPDQYVLRLAATKAAVCAQQLEAGSGLDRPVLAADTSVSIDGLILGKPVGGNEARNMLHCMSGRWHEVYTGLALATKQGIITALSTTRVQLTVLSEQEISAYIASGEPFDKAGAYGIQGLAGIFVRRIEGSYTGVMGLPVHETAHLLKNAGVPIL